MYNSIVIPDGLPAAKIFFQPLAAHHNLKLIYYPLDVIAGWRAGDFDEIEELLSQKPLLFVAPTELKLKGELLQRAQGRVKTFASVSTGVDHVDFSALEQRGIEFINTPGFNSLSVVEYVLGALELFFAEEQLLSGELLVGIIGFGRIGSRLGRAFKQLGINYRYYDPFVADASPEKSDLIQTLQADCLTFHVPLTRGGEHPTYQMVDEEFINLLKPDSAIINSSRGELLSDASYQLATRQHKTLFDVFYQEPPTREMVELAQWSTPHIAGYNYSARAGGARQLALQLARHLGTPQLIPALPDINYQHYSLNFIQAESEKLKAAPESFRARRESYPARGDFKAALRGVNALELSNFQKRLLALEFD